MISRNFSFPVVLGVTLFIGAGAFFWGAYWGERQGTAQGFAQGKREAQLQAAKNPAPVIRNRNHSVEELQKLPQWRELGPLKDGEAERVVELLNRAPSPCWRMARRGASVATSLLDPAYPCSSAIYQVRLALVAARSFAEPDAALAVLRAERRRAVDTEGRYAKGPADAPVVLVEWADFQCPAFRKASKLVDQLVAGGDVRVVYRHFPLRFHFAAFPAAVAAEAAGEHGKFWEMHDALFALGRSIKDRVDPRNQIPKKGEVPFEAEAADLGIPREEFRTLMRSEKLQQRVRQDLAEGRSAAVRATPTFWINQRKMVEPRSLKNFQLLIEKAKAEREWRFSWDLDPLPPGAAEALAQLPPVDPADKKITDAGSVSEGGAP